MAAAENQEGPCPGETGHVLGAPGLTFGPLTGTGHLPVSGVVAGPHAAWRSQSSFQKERRPVLFQHTGGHSGGRAGAPGVTMRAL